MKALCLSGGGVKGAYTTGVLYNWLYEQEIKYDIICGVSVGALNGSFLSQYKLGEEKKAYIDLLNLWGTIDDSKIYKHWCVFRELAGLWKPSLYNSKPLMDMVRNTLNCNKILNSGKKLRIGAVSLNTGKYHLFTEKDPKIAEGVIASSAFPVFFKPIEIYNELWTDGGVKTVTPISAAIDAGATEIDIIMTSPDYSVYDNDKSPNAFHTAMRVIDVMSDEIIANDVKMALLINKAIGSGVTFVNKKEIKFRIVRPKELLIKNSLNFDPKEIKRMMDIGFKDGYLKNNIIA